MEALQMYTNTQLGTAGTRETKYSEDCLSVWHTNRLHRLEEAVKDEVPVDLPLFKRRNIPDQEVGHYGKWSREKDPVKER